MNRIWLSLVAAGLLLCFAFGSLGAAFRLYDAAVRRIAGRIETQGDRVFVTIDRAQKKETPGGAVSYFYSYSGRHGGEKIEKSEQVDANLFHLSSEGKNLEALVYRDPTGTTHAHLRANRESYGKRFDFLANLCFYAAALGALIAAGGGAPLLLSRRRDAANESSAPVESGVPESDARPGE